MESAIRVDANTKLQVVIYATSTVTVNVSKRERINGDVKMPQETTISSALITTDGAPNYFYYNFSGNDSNLLSELLNVAVGVQTANIRRGQCFVRVGLTIGGVNGSATTPFQILFSDYITTNSMRGYPGSQINDSLTGRGFIYPINLAGGAGNQNVSFGLNRTTKLLGLTFLYTASAAVATRTPWVNITGFDAPNANYVLAGYNCTVTATGVKLFMLQQQQYEVREYAFSGSNYVLSFLPADIFITSDISTEGFLTITANNIDANDLIEEISCTVEQWINS